MPSADAKLKQTQQKNAELTARLEVRERINAALVTQLEQEKRELEQQLIQLAHQSKAYELEKAQLLAQLSQFCEANVLLKEELSWWKAQIFGRSSEKDTAAEVSADQGMLFNEAEVLTAIAAAIDAEESTPVLIEAHERGGKPGKKAIPAEFPRILLEPLDVAEADKLCPHDGTALEIIGSEKSERYHFVPPRLEVLVQERLKRACPCCHQGVKIAPLPVHLLPKSMASPSLLAHITTTKFVDGVPLTRQSKQFDRLGLALSAATMGIWMNTIGAEKLPPLINLMHEGALAESLLHCDETTVQVLKSEKPVSSDHYMVVRAAGPPGRRIVLFNYEPNRNVETLKRLLTGPDGPYRGKLVADGLGLYDHVADDPRFELVLCGCLAQYLEPGFIRSASMIHLH